MSPVKPSFLKRDREKKLQEKARLKAERREARKSSPGGGGPPIGTDDNTYPDDPTPPATPDPATDTPE